PAGAMLDAAELLIMQRGAPNLSHALASMPSPYISMRRGLEGERVTLWSAFPGMAESVRGGTLKPLSPQDALNISDRLVALADDRRFDFEIPRPVLRAQLAMQVKARHEDAKKELAESGWDAAQVEKLPHIQVALLAVLDRADRDFDALLLLEGQPFWQAWPEVLARDKK